MNKIIFFFFFFSNPFSFLYNELVILLLCITFVGGIRTIGYAVLHALQFYADVGLIAARHMGRRVAGGR